MQALQFFLNSLPYEAFAVLVALLGVVVGSFLNVVIVRLPVIMHREEQRFVLEANNQAVSDELSGTYTLLKPASHCPQCKSTVRWWMNIPLLSYLLLRGRCASCKLRISAQYPIVELACSAAAVLAVVHFGVTVKACAAMLLLWALITLTVIDLNTQLLPDVITLPIMWAGLLFNTQALFVPLSSAVWGAVLGYLSLWSVYQVFKLITGKDGMGYGDFKLLAALGAWLGVGMLLPMILFSSLAGAAVGLALIALKRRDLTDAIPFGPYLAAGGVLALFYGHQIMGWYLGMFVA